MLPTPVANAPAPAPRPRWLVPVASAAAVAVIVGVTFAVTRNGEHPVPAAPATPDTGVVPWAPLPPTDPDIPETSPGLPPDEITAEPRCRASDLRCRQPESDAGWCRFTRPRDRARTGVRTAVSPPGRPSGRDHAGWWSADRSGEAPLLGRAGGARPRQPGRPGRGEHRLGRDRFLSSGHQRLDPDQREWRCRTHDRSHGPGELHPRPRRCHTLGRACAVVARERRHLSVQQVVGIGRPRPHGRARRTARVRGHADQPGRPTPRPVPRLPDRHRDRPADLRPELRCCPSRRRRRSSRTCPPTSR